MKNQTIRERYAALTVLSQRTLPSPAAINKVTFLLTRRFSKAYEATEQARKNIWNQFPLPDDHEGDRIPQLIAEKRQLALDAYLAESQAVKAVPDQMKLRNADMPKVLKGDDGYKNAEGLASIMASLGGLYVREGNEIVKDDATGEEPDQAAEPTEEDPMRAHEAAEPV